MARIAFFGAGYAGLVTGACFADLGHDGRRSATSSPSGSTALRAGRVPFYEPGLAELIERNADRLSFTLDAGGGDRRLRVPLRLRRHAADALGRRRPLAVWTVIEELPPVSGRSMLVMKSTVPVGTGEKVRAGSTRAG